MEMGRQLSPSRVTAGMLPLLLLLLLVLAPPATQGQVVVASSPAPSATPGPSAGAPAPLLNDTGAAVTGNLTGNPAGNLEGAFVGNVTTPGGSGAWGSHCVCGLHEFGGCMRAVRRAWSEEESGT